MLKPVMKVLLYKKRPHKFGHLNPQDHKNYKHELNLKTITLTCMLMLNLV